MKKNHILLVEDNEGDVVLTLEALHESKIKNIVSVVRDGVEALQFLNKEGKYKGAVTPDLVLLDINLPKVDGKEVLAYIKTHAVLKKIPVIVLTTSSSEKDVTDVYNLYANCFISKPVDLLTFMKVVKAIEDFWISIVHIPQNK